MNGDSLANTLAQQPAPSSSSKLQDGSRVAVMGAGPAGSFFAYYLLDVAQRAGLHLEVDIYEPRDFSQHGPAGCNMDAGIISESLVQFLAVEGINLPPSAIKQGLDSYVLHMDVGKVRIEAPLNEKRIASVYRGAGPLGSSSPGDIGFDAFCLNLAIDKGARWIQQRVVDVRRGPAGVLVRGRDNRSEEYALLSVATGVNTSILRLFPLLEPEFRPPVTIRTMIREYALGAEAVRRYLGDSFHVFLLDLPGLDFAAILPKGEHATVCFLGTDLSEKVYAAFLNSREVQACMPPDWEPGRFVCHCSPRMQLGPAVQPYSERLVFIGDSGVSRLYKDGIGAAYRTAKAAATTAVFHGIGADDFRAHFWPTCQAIATDNRLGKLVFAVTRQIQHRRFARRALLRMVNQEQHQPGNQQWMSTVLWDTFTGSAPYRDIFWRMIQPAYFGGLLRHVAGSLLAGKGEDSAALVAHAGSDR